MAEPIERAKEINEVLDLVGMNEGIRNDICWACLESATVFKDRISRQEFKISGLCQRCQDGVFDVEEED